MTALLITLGVLTAAVILAVHHRSPIVLGEFQDVIDSRAGAQQRLASLMTKMGLAGQRGAIAQSVFRATRLHPESFDSWGKDDLPQ